MNRISSALRVSDVHTRSGHPDGREDELHIEIDQHSAAHRDIIGVGRLIVPKSNIRKIANALLDANTTGRLRSSGKQPAPEEPEPAKEYRQTVVGGEVQLYQEVASDEREIPVFTPEDRARHDERMTKRLRASELLTKLQASCPDHKEDLIELVVLCRGQGIL